MLVKITSYFQFFLLASVMILSIGCQKIETIFEPESPRALYKKEMQGSALAQKPIVQHWLASGDSILSHPVSVSLPFQTKMMYFSDEANAWAWQFPLLEGRTLHVHLSRSDTTQQVFVDLFSIENGKPHLDKSVRDSIISFTASQNRMLILRLQAELLVDGSATLTLADQPSMDFPVQGGTRSDIGGLFGDPRDGGTRKHKGVDIFANRGTPALAAAKGRVIRTGNHGLGGKQVWLRSDGKSLYYAHLDSINSHRGQKVNPGDTVGFIGNTGNASSSPPHLHFGIYAHGAINPLPFINSTFNQPEPLTAEPAAFPRWGRIATVKANVRPLPSTQKPPIKSLKKENTVEITGGTGDWYHVVLPDGTRGFIYGSLVEPANTRLHRRKVTPHAQFFTQFAKQNLGFSPDTSGTVNVFGHYKNRVLVKYRAHWMWMHK